MDGVLILCKRLNNISDFSIYVRLSPDSRYVVSMSFEFQEVVFR